MKPFSNPLYFWTVFLLALVFYHLPWILTPGVGLNMGAYDLAEWASLHPIVRVSSPPLLHSFILRLPLALLALIVAFTGRRNGKNGGRLLIVGLIALALLPPLEFFTQYPNDPNYRQQFALAFLTLLVGGIGLTSYLNRWRRLIVIALTVLGAASSIWGFWQGYTLLREFHLPLNVGVGGPGLAVCFLLLIVFDKPVPLRWKTNKVART